MHNLTNQLHKRLRSAGEASPSGHHAGDWSSLPAYWVAPGGREADHRDRLFETGDPPGGVKIRREDAADVEALRLRRRRMQKEGQREWPTSAPDLSMRSRQ
jgi:hypothetical protein